MHCAGLSTTVEPHSRLTAEALGAALLLTIVIGSGIMAGRLTGGNTVIVLLINTATTVDGLCALVGALGPINGAHFSPVVSAVVAVRDELHGIALPPYIVTQVLNVVLGVWLAYAMFDVTLLQFPTKVRSGARQWTAEAAVAASLLPVILRAPNGRAASMVTTCIGVAYWFTAPTSFTSPAAVFGRMFNNNFAGIASGSVPGLMLAECVGAALDVLLHSLLEPRFAAAGHPNVIESSGRHLPYI